MHRLFVALRPPSGIRTALLDLMEGVPGARWQDDDQLHVTLRYIGEVDARTADDVAAALGGVHAAPLELRLSGCGIFDTRGRANALWAGVAPREPLAALHRKLDQALVRVGLEPERRAYLPHITLARLGGGSPPLDRFVADHAGLASPPFRVEHMVLYESHLGQGGSIYEPVECYPLNG
ncbi:RNA 2',3'-cyclic phosphodiesterase [Sphingomonas turrisvirgatae]|uniref:RNA 2',3'-cyclic phosphodiesterase n=1 Tax=Sphingomonas turrisvirgatae TaxID=1888892 RepID=A0A1E3LTQ6_9SPHN|nr:RNA 2',3'-cyclic phosphodiesterase [Sphingomonas turrisvirgatae]ODP37119.1 2'-5' RNA ligase [Sphingomonas turrisvirgatae]